jgi:outer membrane biosynthesis protein TonB
MQRALHLVAFILLAVLESSCHKNRAVAPAPPPPTPAAPALAPATPAASTTTPEQPPEQPPEPTPTPVMPAPPPPLPSSTQNPAPAPTPTAPPAVPPRVPARPSNPPPAAPAPQLGPVLTAAQQRQYNSAIDESLERAQTSLRSIGNRALTKQQQATLEETQNFIRQAQATRGKDLAGARRLAERAEVLAKNLEKSLH